MSDFYCVIYYKGRLWAEKSPICEALAMYLEIWSFGYVTDEWKDRARSVNIVSDDPAIDIFIDRLIIDHEIHVTYNEGERLLDIFYVSG